MLLVPCPDSLGSPFPIGSVSSPATVGVQDSLLPPVPGPSEESKLLCPELLPPPALVACGLWLPGGRRWGYKVLPASSFPVNWRASLNKPCAHEALTWFFSMGVSSFLDQKASSDVLLMMIAEYNTTMQAHFKHLFVAHLSASHWPTHMISKIQSQGVGRHTLQWEEL